MAEGIIPGISAFCDNWCERCPFQKRCEDYPSTKSTVDEVFSNPVLVSKFRQNLEKAMRKIEREFDVSDLDVYKMLANAQSEYKGSESNQLLSNLSITYSEFTKAWLKSQPGMLDRLEQLKEELTIGTETVDVGKATAEAIKNALAVIHWDEPLIQSRLKQAMGLKLKSDDEAIRKANGLAKVALLSMDRSMESWQMLFELLPDREDDFLRILSTLEKLRRTTEHEFPLARQFRRPGFDD